MSFRERFEQADQANRQSYERDAARNNARGVRQGCGCLMLLALLGTMTAAASAAALARAVPSVASERGPR